MTWSRRFEDPVSLPDGREYDFEMIHHPGAAAVVPLLGSYVQYLFLVMLALAVIAIAIPNPAKPIDRIAGSGWATHVAPAARNPMIQLRITVMSNAANTEPNHARTPNVIARVGHACWQAVTISPSRSCRSSVFAFSSANWIRCTQNVHFSITPAPRTVTSGLSCRFSGAGHSGTNQLNRRTLYGQLFSQ